jgi:hypothetical protein
VRFDVPGIVRQRARDLAIARGMPGEEIDRVLRSTGGTETPAPTVEGALEVESLAQLYEASLESPSRRRSGSHYTTAEVAARIAEAALAPLFEVAGTRALELTVCDPSMGGGACLLAAARWLAAKAVAQGEAATPRDALTRIAGNVFGVDIDPAAAAIARVSLWLEVGDAEASIDSWTARLRVGDGLAGDVDGRFDVMLGNPPWVSYVGRAAQPLEDAVRQRYTSDFASFAGYRNLQGLFLERAASLLRPGGRMAFLVPSSMSEQVGYAPTRRAVASYVDSDGEMADVGEDAFAGVVQPCMIFAGTRRAEPSPATAPAKGGDHAWRVRRTDLCPVGRQLLERLCALPPLPSSLFGERGVQTSGADAADMADAPDARRDWPLLSGSDIGPFRCGDPVRFADRSRFAKRFTDMRWAEVAFVVRQTAMFPIAAHARGHAFRNSLLAGFAGVGDDEEWTADFLVGWLNSSPIRWLHFHRFRDARQGLPQVKVGHLRSVPRPSVGVAGAAERVRARERVREIAGVARSLGEANSGIAGEEQRELDAIVGEVLGLTGEERAVVERGAGETPTPVSRRK